MTRRLALVVFGCLLCAFAPNLLAGPKGPKEADIERARELKRAGKLKESAEVLRQATAKWPTDARMWLALSYILEANSDFSGAQEALKRVLTLQPNAPNIMSRLHDLGKKAEQQKASTETYLTPEEKKARDLFQQALKEKSFGQFDLAFQHFIDVVDLDPKYLDGRDGGMISAALNFYKSRQKTDVPNALYYLGVYQLFQQNFDSAEALLRECLSKNPAPEMVTRVNERLLAIQKAKDALAASVAQDVKPEPAAKPLDQASGRTDAPPPSASAPASPDQVPAPAEEAAPPELVGVPADGEFVGKSPDELLAEARAARAAGDTGRAINFLNAATRANPTPSGFMELADIYHESAKNGVNKDDSMRTAIRYYQTVMKQYPSSSEAAQARSRVRGYQAPAVQRAQEVLDYFQKSGFPNDN